MNRIFYLVVFFILVSCKNEESIRFAVCTDVHQDLIHDASIRLNKFIETAEADDADFIIQLGDFCMPEEENEPFVDVWNSFDGNKYHVLGNHDMDISSKQVIQDFWGMKEPYYSFDQGEFHFVVLDPNYFWDGEKAISYNNGNYYAHASGRAFIPQEQLEWLRKDLEATDKYTVVFSHQSLEHEHGIKNRQEVRKLFAAANRDKKKVIACFCGHDHEDRHAEIEGIHYIGLNSTSYAWVGKKMEFSGRFSEETEKKFPNLKYTLPYEEPVFAFIEIDPKGIINIKGVEGDFVKPGPEEVGVKEHNYSATISNRTLNF